MVKFFFSSIYLLTKTSLNFFRFFYAYVNPWNSSTLSIYIYVHKSAMRNQLFCVINGFIHTAVQKMY